jgi:hypothetical protein
MTKRIVLSALFLAFLATGVLYAKGTQGGGNVALDDKLATEAFIIIQPPAKGSFEKLQISDNTSGNILFEGQNITTKRIVVIPTGEYTVARYDGKNTIKNKITIKEQPGVLTLSGSNIVFNEIKDPPAIAFMRGDRWDLTTITEGTSYYLTLFDKDNLDTLPVGAYNNVHISGPGINKDIELAAATQNTRYISADALTFAQGTLTVTANLQGNTKTQRITVVPKPPFVLTVTNTWNGRPLQYANVQFFRSTAKLAPQITKTEFDTFTYNNRNNTVFINGGEVASSGSEGKITLRELHDKDSLLVFIKGVMPNDPIYVKSIVVDENNPNMRLSWDNIPSKGRNFDFEASIDYSASNSWARIDNFTVSFYYKAGSPATIRKQTVLSDSGWTVINANFRREGDNRITVFADLDRICKVSHFNYLLVVNDEYEGKFSMANTADEISIQPVLFKEDE